MIGLNQKAKAPFSFAPRVFEHLSEWKCEKCLKNQPVHDLRKIIDKWQDPIYTLYIYIYIWHIVNAAIARRSKMQTPKCCCPYIHWRFGVFFHRNHSDSHDSKQLVSVALWFLSHDEMWMNISWVVPPPSNGGKWRSIGIPTKKTDNPGGDCYSARGTTQYFSSLPQWNR